MTMHRDIAETVIMKSWTKKVHITPGDEFSTCSSDCECCSYRAAFDVYTTPRIDKVKLLCDTFNVKGRNGKVYTYFAVSQTAIEFLIENCMESIESEAEVMGILLKA
jgi:hypothetical protein